MSEWKMCLDCHHGYDQHVRDGRGYRPCSAQDCQCLSFYNVRENF